MEKLILTAKTRGLSKPERSALRRAQQVPAVVYGHNYAPVSIAISAGELERVYNKGGMSTLIELSVEGAKPETVVIHDIQRHPVNGRFLHADLYHVKMDEKMSAEVPIVLTGIAPAVKELSAILVHHLDHLKVDCLPKDLPHEISVDISGLDKFGAEIMVKDVVLPNGVTVDADVDVNDVVVVAQEAKAEIAVEAAPADAAEAEKAAIEGQEVEKKGKEEESTEE